MLCRKVSLSKASTFESLEALIRSSFSDIGDKFAVTYLDEGDSTVILDDDDLKMALESTDDVLRLSVRSEKVSAHLTVIIHMRICIHMQHV